MASDSRLRILELKAKALAASNLQEQEQATPIQDSQQVPEQGLMGRLQEREENIGEIKAQRETGEIGPVRSTLRQAGEGAGAALDVAGTAVVEGAKAGAKLLTPKALEEPGAELLSKAGEGLIDVLEDTPGPNVLFKAAPFLADKYGEFKGKHPEAAKDLEALANVALLAAPVKGKPKVKSKPTSIGKVGGKVSATAKAQKDKQIKAFSEELVQPKQTPKVRVDQAGRTEVVGPLQKKVVTPSFTEKMAATEVAKLEGISPKNIMQKNLNIIDDAVRVEGDNLVKKLKESPVVFPRQEIKAHIKNSLDEALVSEPLITGDLTKTAQVVFDEAQRIINKNPSTGSGLLQARKDFDKFITSRTVTQSGKTALEGERLTATNIAAKRVRNTMNDFLDSKVTNIEVKESLRKQHNLLNAKTNLAPKAADQGATIITRLAEKITKSSGIKSKAGQGAALLLAGGGAGAVAAGAPIVATGMVGATIAAQITRGAMSAKSKEIVGALIKGADKIIRTSKDEALVSRLRADRAALLQLLDANKENNDE